MATKFVCDKFENCIPCRHHCKKDGCPKSLHMKYNKENSKTAITNCIGCPLEFSGDCDKYIIFNGEIKEVTECLDFIE